MFFSYVYTFFLLYKVIYLPKQLFRQTGGCINLPAVAMVVAIFVTPLYDFQIFFKSPLVGFPDFTCSFLVNRNWQHLLLVNQLLYPRVV